MYIKFRLQFDLLEIRDFQSHRKSSSYGPDTKYSNWNDHTKCITKYKNQALNVDLLEVIYNIIMQYC